MSDEGKAEAQRLQDLFEGAKGRRPKTDQELNVRAKLRLFSKRRLCHAGERSAVHERVVP